MSSLIDRAASPVLDELAGALRVVIINGPRQSGKTTLLKEYQRRHGGTYRTLDDRQMLIAAHEDPLTFARYGDPPRLIDEVQRGGDSLVRSIKMAVDDDPRPGQFILSGSSRFLTIPSLSESLAGRAVFLDLWPLSTSERTGGPINFLDRAFTDPQEPATADSAWTRDDYIQAIVQGGYPEVRSLKTALTRRSWYRSHLATIIERDIRDFASVHQTQALPALLGLIAARAGSTTVISDLARSVDLNRETVKNYLAWLDMVFLTMTLPAWSGNLNSRIAKTPKLYPTDSGLAAYLLQAGTAQLKAPGNPLLGTLLEIFVATELLKLRTFAEADYSLWHYRDQSKREVDFIIEGPGGRIIAMELKASVSPGPSAVQNLRWLKERLGDRMVAGYLLHLGPHGASYGNGVHALPVSALWGHARPA